jgi:hypothetical protein
MCTHKVFGLYAGVFFVREGDNLDAALVLGTQRQVQKVATFHSKIDVHSGLLTGETKVGVSPGDESRSQAYLAGWACGLYAFAFAHCRNVNVVEQSLPAHRERKFRRKHGKSPLRYHVLDIKPLVRQVRAKPGEGSEQLRALHICRGHFRTYTEQRKLFGKVSGTFWVEEHARGSADEGIVVKDYRMQGAACRS